MTPEEEHDYQEALHRIEEAERTGTVELSLSELHNLTRLPPELKRLTSLQLLDLSRCEQLSGDLSPLAALTSLQSLYLSYCQLSDLSPLAGLTSLQLL
jgi:internalin A